MVASGLTAEEITELPAKLLSGDALALDDQERNFLASLVLRFGHVKPPPREVSAMRARMVADWIYVQRALSEACGRKPPLRKQLVSRAAEVFSLSERRISIILKKHKDRLETLRQGFRELPEACLPADLNAYASEFVELQRLCQNGQ